MRKMSDLLPENKTLHIWAYGEPGSGKTKMAIQVAKLGRTLFLAVENGLTKKHFDGIPMENVCLLGPDSMQDLNTAYNKLADFQTTFYKWKADQSDALKEKLRKLDEYFTGGTVDPITYWPRPFIFVVVDTLTDVQKDTIIHQNPRNAKDFTQSKPMQIQQWGMSNAMLDMLTDALVKQENPYPNIRVNTIWISHEKSEKDKEGNIVKILPALSGQNPATIGAKMDIVAYCKLEEKQGARLQSLIVQKHSKYKNTIVKDRTDMLGNILTDRTPGSSDIMIRVCKNCAYLPEPFLRPAIAGVKEIEKVSK
jgi:hypothetical protein